MAITGSPHEVILAARPESPRAARNQVRAWLDAASWPTDLIHDLVYAVNEAVTNAVEHAYSPGDAVQTIELTLQVEHGHDGTRRARVHIRDHGRWRVFRPGFGRRGYGLILMRALMDEVIIQPVQAGRGGTLAVLLSRPAPAVARRR
ncbi:MAG: ATP-binding protein [Pseudonocardia sp.]|uniref:ATP-binding protein n=1 Tax=Pseudonocardia sp. TaxID=60912 RepID=UPI001AC24F71|nr:ATP-binding protein [Pseudonocardia sp.]MBN9099380.1 ATP-binding protein [Pseudonocardia sp.]